MGTITISMLFLVSFLLLSVNINNWIKGWGESLTMSVYLEDGIDEIAKKKIESRLTQLKGAELNGFISKEQAMTHLKEALGTQEGLLSGLKKNPLPSSFEIVFKDVIFSAAFENMACSQHYISFITQKNTCFSHN